VPESARDIYRRSVDALRMPPVEEWETFPFDGEMRPRALLAPADEPALEGEGGVACRACTKPDDECLWTDERWRLSALPPSGLPVILILEPRAHYAAPGDLPDDLAAECGVMLGRVERAVRSLDGIGRVHVCRWGEGAEHLHWWFLGRPSGLTQLMSSFAAIWDDVLPPTPQDVWQDNLARVVEHLRSDQR
jgi:diadenosine tetraphosphate (Ap4A) HIT family hydrolase